MTQTPNSWKVPRVAGLLLWVAVQAGALDERPGLLFREDWKETPPATPVTRDHVAHPDLILTRHGPAEARIRKSHHDRPADDPYYIWSGETEANWAISFRHRSSLFDLSGQAKIRWRAKQSGFRQLRIVLKLADGRWVVSDQYDGESADWRVREFNLQDVRWRALNIEKVTEGRWEPDPDLSRVEEVGVTDLMSGGRTQASSRLDWIEVYGRAVPRDVGLTSVHVHRGADGRLVYAADERGNRIPDFSHSGYRGGGVSLPVVPVRVVVAPGDGDDGARIQAAVDEVAKLAPDRNGHRGAVLLRRGRYQVAGSIRMTASGIVLRGEGQDESGTVIEAVGRERRSVIVVEGSGPQPDSTLNADDRVDAGYRERPGSRRRITDAYVPAGARSFTLEHASGLTVGDTIVVHRPSTAKWIAAIGMDRIPPRSDGGRIVQWREGTKDIFYNRVITAIAGRRITIDAPLFHWLDQEYERSAVFKYDDTGLIEEVGIENLRGVSSFEHPEDEEHAWVFVALNLVRNAWVRNVSAVHFGGSCVRTGNDTKWITVQDSEALDLVSRITGGRRYPFSMHGQLHLVQRCYATHGRHDFATGTHRSSGIVFLDCLSENIHAASEPHHRYSTGVLYDNVHHIRPDTRLVLGIVNRANLGTGHGWTAAYSVIWNCAAPEGGIACESPPLARNWAIGVRSRLMSANLRTGAAPPGLTTVFAPGATPWEHWNAGAVGPASLYWAQLIERLDRERPGHGLPTDYAFRFAAPGGPENAASALPDAVGQAAPPRVQRTWMPDAHPSSFAVGFPHALNLCFDPVRAEVVYAWRGDFVDLTPTMNGKIPRDAIVRGTMFYRVGPREAFNALGETTPAKIRFCGYRVAAGRLELHYEVNGIEVRETVTAAVTGDGIMRDLHVAARERALEYHVSPPARIEVLGGATAWRNEALVLPGGGPVVFRVFIPGGPAS